ncbi:MAG: hypothetical protein ACREHV_17455 [Rhizomicrobium sp.]
MKKRYMNETEMDAAIEKHRELLARIGEEVEKRGARLEQFIEDIETKFRRVFEADARHDLAAIGFAKIVATFEQRLDALEAAAVVSCDKAADDTKH